MKTGSRTSAALSLGALCALLGSAPRADAQALGTEFQVNSYTTSNQRRPSAAAAANGDFVVVWDSYGSTGGDTSSSSVQGQRYAADGTARGDNFQVNTFTTSYQRVPRVAVETDGDFVVVWFSAGQDGSGAAIEGQRYASDGTARGGEFQVNTYTTNQQRYPSVGVGLAGDFVVVWQSTGSNGGDVSNYSVQAQRYASDGTPRGAQFQVNTYTTNRQSNGVVAVEADGDFVVAWDSLGSSGGDTSGPSIQGQRYASDGTARGGEFQVNSYTTNTQYRSSIAVKSDGEFVVSWQSFAASPGDDTGLSVQARRFASDGSPKGTDFQVNTYTTSYQYSSSIGLEANGDFVVSWQSVGSLATDTSGFSAQARRYASDGTPRGAEFQVNTFTTNAQSLPTVAVAPSGNFVVAWSSYTQDGHLSGVFGRRFTIPAISLSDGSVTEGDAGQVNVAFTATLSEISDFDVSVQYSTADDTAMGGVDYVVSSGTVSFAAGETSQTFNVVVLGDLLDEPDETFFVNLDTPVDATIADGQGLATINDDDPPALSISDTSVTETNASINATFTITLSAASGSNVTVDWATALIGGATSGVDYTASSGTATVLAGNTTTTFDVTVIGDLNDEGPEYFFVDITNGSGATIADGQARCLITDDDPFPVVGFSGVEPISTEGDASTSPQAFFVSLTGPTERIVEVSFATGTAGTATSGVDYAAKTGFLRFQPGQTTKELRTQITGDLLDEPRETYFVNLSAPINGTISDGQSMGTIVDNDPTPGGSPDLTIGNAAAVLEGDTGTVNATFTVTLSFASTNAVTFTYGTGAGGTATSGVDYVGFILKTATIAVGQTTKTITVAVNGDDVDESNETFFVNVTSASNANITDSQGQGTITDDEP